MAIDKARIKQEIAAALPASFLDDVTGYKPQRETELTARLVVLHQRRAIHWDRVPLYRPTYEPAECFADSLFSDGGIMVCEYPLFCQPMNENIWGDMKADLLYLSEDRRIAVVVENKIGSEFTSGGNDVETGQIARQIEYLNASLVEQPHFVLVSARKFFEARWYWSEVADTMKHKTHCTRVHTHLMTWEDIFHATAP